MPRNNKKTQTIPAPVPEQESAIARSFLKGCRPCLWLCLLIAAVYGQTLGFGLTNYDDDQLILNNQAFIKDLSNLGQAFRQDVLSNPKGLFYYRPLLTASLMLDAQLGGTGPFVYHLTNLLLHLLACWLLFILLSKLTGQRGGSFLAVLVFSVHPVLTQAVVWVPGRNDSLLAVFLLGAMAAFIRNWEGGKWTWSAVSQLLFLASLFTKETAVVFPLICMGYVCLSSKPSPKIRIHLIINMAGWLLGVLLWYLLREQAMTLSGAWRGFQLFTAAEAAKGLFSYLSKLAIPVDLSVIPDLRNLQWQGGVAVLVIAAAAVFWLGFRNRKLALFGLWWTALFLLPVLTVVPGPKAFLEHRMYLPLMGILLLLLSLDARKIPAMFKPGVPIAAILLYSSVSMAHSRVFKDDLSCWLNGVQTSPDSDIARNGLGKAYYQRGRISEAARQFLFALRQEPDNPVYLYNAAALYLTVGDIGRADSCITRELELYPSYPKANFIRAQVLEARGMTAGAERHYLQEISANPGYLKAYMALAAVYMQQGNYRQAREILSKAAVMAPANYQIKKMIAEMPGTPNDPTIRR